MVYDRSDKHLTIYDSYIVKCAAKMMKSIELANISDAYSATDTMKFDTSNDIQNTCCENNMLHGIDIDIALLQFPITSITLS